MEGLLPLIEGFLAFALTMLVLTTAVSTVVGAGHRLRRRRARGLRDNPSLQHEFAAGDGRYTLIVRRARVKRVGSGEFLRFSIVPEPPGVRFRPRGFFVRGRHEVGPEA